VLTADDRVVEGVKTGARESFSAAAPGLDRLEAAGVQ
jgi:hypothetical protein